ncbi:uncharacterized protein LOC135682203 [Rhopilema esculentum]|uniref:uncharacterized protein LOC135682203 n=1 Tax=Rhopilema esculentum TaxID=499914 RepID=UPI0031DA2C54
MKQCFQICCIILLTLCLFGTAASYSLNITFWQNKPYLFMESGQVQGTFKRLMAGFKSKECEPDGFQINYVDEKKTFSDLLESLNSNTSHFGEYNDTIIAYLPVLPTTSIDHALYHNHDMYTILQSPGYTLVVNSLMLTKMYRIIVFGFFESATLLITLTCSTLVFGGIVWFLERKQGSNDTDFAYHFVPGLWDGFWWAAVTGTTVGYGDKTPKTPAGKAVGLVWLITSCIILAAFGAIMTSSVTTETISIAGKKIAYLNNTYCSEAIKENAGIPVVTKTVEEALELARTIKLFGALIDTHYISSRQDELFEKGILIDQRFHKEKLDIRMWSKKIPSAKMNKCFQEFFNFLNNSLSQMPHIEPRLKNNRHWTLKERIGAAGHGLLVVYCLIAGLVFLWLLIGLIDHLRAKRKQRLKKVDCKKAENGKNPEMNADLIYQKLENISNELADVKTWVKNMEQRQSELKQDGEKNEFKIHTSSSMCFGDSNMKNEQEENCTQVDEHKL